MLGSRAVLKHFSNTCTKLIEDLAEFSVKNAQNDDRFRFWDIFRADIIPLVNDLVGSDRKEKWDLHLQCVQKALHLFAAFDSTNYLRW